MPKDAIENIRRSDTLSSTKMKLIGKTTVAPLAVSCWQLLLPQRQVFRCRQAVNDIDDARLNLGELLKVSTADLSVIMQTKTPTTILGQ